MEWYHWVGLGLIILGVILVERKIIKNETSSSSCKNDDSCGCN